MVSSVDAAPAAAAVFAPSGPTLRHGRFEDAQALFTGSLFVSITMMLFAQAGLLTGSTAGVAFLLYYVTGLPFGAIFFVICFGMSRYSMHLERKLKTDHR